MIRPGHHRPIGSTTALWRFQWHDPDHPPQLGDVVLEIVGPGGDPGEVERAYEVVAVIETASAKWPYKLQLERLAYEPALVRDADPAQRSWYFWTERTPRT